MERSLLAGCINVNPEIENLFTHSADREDVFARVFGNERGASMEVLRQRCADAEGDNERLRLRLHGVEQELVRSTKVLTAQDAEITHQRDTANRLRNEVQRLQGLVRNEAITMTSTGNFSGASGATGPPGTAGIAAGANGASGPLVDLVDRHNAEVLGLLDPTLTADSITADSITKQMLDHFTALQLKEGEHLIWDPPDGEWPKAIDNDPSA